MQHQTNTAVGTQMELSEFMNYVFMVMAAGLFVTASMGYMLALNEDLMKGLFHTYQALDEDGKTVTEFGASGWWWAAAGTQLVMVITMSTWGRIGHISMTTGVPVFLLFAALVGFTMAPVLYAYTATSVAKVFLITAITFCASGIWGWTTKKDMTGMGNFFLFALIGLLVAMIVNFIFGSPVMDYLISMVAVLLFAALVAFDMQMLRKMHAESSDHAGLIVSGALALYLDFLNMFLHLLRLFGVKVTGD